MKDQITLLKELAEKLDKEPRTRESALKSLYEAGIMTKDGEISDNYPHLKRVMKAQKE